MFDYLRALDAIKPKCLYFTHYGFLKGRIPAKEIASAVVYLASPEAGFVIATVMHINDGIRMY